MSHSAPNITWHFEALSTISGYAHKPEVSAPVDAKVEDLIAELEASGYEGVRLANKEWEKWAWPGGYPLFYVCKDNEPICPACCNREIARTADPARDDPQWTIVGVDINYEDEDLYCSHCAEHIESAYGNLAAKLVREGTCTDVEDEL